MNWQTPLLLLTGFRNLLSLQQIKTIEQKHSKFIIHFQRAAFDERNLT